LIQRIPHAHIQLYIITKYYSASKLNYFLRNIHLDIDSKWWKEIIRIQNRLITAAIKFIINDYTRKQIELPTNMGGLGLCNPQQVACAAYLSAISNVIQSRKYKIVVNEAVKIFTHQNIINNINECILSYNKHCLSEKQIHSEIDIT